jgi:hypothetical protein
MIDPVSLFFSGVCLGAAVLFVLFPNPLSKLSAALNQTLVVLDNTLLRYRFLVALALFGASYLLFRLAILVPAMRA